MGSSGSTVGSWVRASQSLPPYGIRAPPWQDVVAHAAHTGALHPWWCARMVYRSSPAWYASIARNLGSHKGSWLLVVTSGERMGKLHPLNVSQCVEGRRW